MKPSLRVIQGGATFLWVDDAAAREAKDLFVAKPMADVVLMDVLVRELLAGRLLEDRPGRKGDYGPTARHPKMYELRIDQTVPRLRLYWVERRSKERAYMVGLLLAPKPDGGVKHQRTDQNVDIDAAWSRLDRWRSPRT